MDRVTILAIKAERIRDAQKRRHVLKEYALLQSIMEEQGIRETSEAVAELKKRGGGQL